MNDRPSYPWKQGEELFAEELNAAIANAGSSGAFNAQHYGVVCDGVTDDGAALNAMLASLGRGVTIFIPGSVYTTQTIVVSNGQRLEMPPASTVRPFVGSPLIITTRAIIGPPTLSLGRDGDRRRGRPDQCRNYAQWRARRRFHRSAMLRSGPDLHLRLFVQPRPLYSDWGTRSAPVNGMVSAITTQFDHCITWNSTEDGVYLLNAPETTFFDHRFGIVGETSPNLGNSLLCIDGDNNNATAGATNTVSLIRCQFNPAATVPQLYTIRCVFWNYGVLKLVACYSGGSTNAFLYIDTSCTKVSDVNLIGNTISPMAATETLISDPGHRLVGLKLVSNWIDGGTSPGLFLSGISAQIIGNSFGGPFTVQLDAMTSGICSGNSVNTLSFTGVFAGQFIAAHNQATTFVQTATGPINYVELLRQLRQPGVAWPGWAEPPHGLPAGR